MRVTPLEAIIARPHGDPTNRLIRQQWVDWSSNVDRFVVISGCSSGGKSTLIAELGKRGHAVVDEPGRRIVKEELASGGSALPWLDGVAFARRAMRIYVRQSTAGQVRQHQESTELQYRLIDRAALFGWPKERIEVMTTTSGSPVRRATAAAASSG
jgi:hypothetical protein